MKNIFWNTAVIHCYDECIIFEIKLYFVNPYHIIWQIYIISLNVRIVHGFFYKYLWEYLS